MDKRHEFMALYQGLLNGLNLVQQKTWPVDQLEHFFPDLKDDWAPLLAGRHIHRFVCDEKLRVLEQLQHRLLLWDNPIEAGILQRRLGKIAGYFREVDKEFCDEDSLKFFLQDFSLLQIDCVARPASIMLISPRVNSTEAKVIIDAELKILFPSHNIQTILSSGTIARASTTRTGIRLREDATFTREELAMLTVHEAWVHLGSNLAGQLQKDLPWLSSWHPGVTGFQEGLALIAEIICGHWNESREMQILLRHHAATLALQGFDARKVWEYLRDHGLSSTAALEMTLRVFRGCELSGGMAFGKEFQYLLGLNQWLIRQETVTAEDMRLALAGKMDFLEWEILKSTPLKASVLLPSPPDALLHWNTHPHLTELRSRLSFKKAA